ncbi:MAG TPA: acyl-CoA carboxylase epsilon subunit [Trebonia sp.]|nr:acyl-CoA carboxylase epsilon subunit [Trebonia sp.]
MVRGDATAEEIAALVATLTAVAAARSAAAASAERPSASPNWNARARLLRAPVHPAAGGWRRSNLP